MFAKRPSQLHGGLVAEWPTVSRVASTAEYARSARRIDKLCGSPGDDRSWRLQVLDEISDVIDFDSYAWLLTDPQTSVGCAPVADVPSLRELPRLIRLKYLTPINRWTRLGDARVALLAETTGGNPSRSLLWRELLSGYGVVDVASVVFEDRFGCWGFLDLWRRGGCSTFERSEAAFLAAIAVPIAASLRRIQANTFLVASSGQAGRLGPVVLLLSADLDVQAQTAETEQRLRLLVPSPERAAPIPASAYNVGAQLLAAEAGVDSSAPFARMHLAGGEWVTVRAARIGSDRPLERRNIAITIEACSPAERLEVFSATFGLSAREREILELLATGCDTRELARTAFVSEHTVQDHLKSIFVKTGSHSRRTLLSRALGR
jgi:DNA-binding CsgD family transcriptional regulator